MNKNKLSGLFTYPLRSIVDNKSIDINYLQEIRMRTGRPLIVTYKGNSYFAKANGSLCTEANGVVMVNNKMLTEAIQIFSSYSFYAFEEEVRQGFLTIPGGHRVGICGKAVVESGSIKTIKDISSINIRIAHQVIDCAGKLINKLFNGNVFFNTLIVSPPGGGKTTLLRDLIRQISNGSDKRKGLSVGVVDERSEIAACYRGVPQNDVGIRTDVLDSCPKQEGMIMLLRSMSPNVIAVDEIGQSRDYEALTQAMFCGTKIIATVHGDTYEDLLNKPVLADLISQKVFERVVVLRSREVEKILDACGKLIE